MLENVTILPTYVGRRNNTTEAITKASQAQGCRLLRLPTACLSFSVEYVDGETVVCLQLGPEAVKTLGDTSKMQRLEDAFTVAGFSNMSSLVPVEDSIMLSANAPSMTDADRLRFSVILLANELLRELKIISTIFELVRLGDVLKVSRGEIVTSDEMCAMCAQ